MIISIIGKLLLKIQEMKIWMNNKENDRKIVLTFQKLMKNQGLNQKINVVSKILMIKIQNKVNKVMRNKIMKKKNKKQIFNSKIIKELQKNIYNNQSNN